MTIALKGCPAGLLRFGAVSSCQNVKKSSVTPRMLTFDARVCVCGATTVPFNKIAGTLFCRCNRSGWKKWSARSACWIAPSRSVVRFRRLPRTESPTIKAPASTPVATAVQSATVRCICQKCLRAFQENLRIILLYFLAVRFFIFPCGSVRWIGGLRSLSVYPPSIILQATVVHYFSSEIRFGVHYEAEQSAE